MRRRFATIVLAAATFTLLTAVPALAADLDEYLEAAEDAEYAGRRLVMTTWNGTSSVGVYELAHAGDVTRIGDGSTESMVGAGKMAGASGSVVFPEWSAAALDARYRARDPQPETRLGRPAHGIEVLENGQLRAKIVFDDHTGAPLVTEVFDGSGRLFRYSAMVEFDQSPVLVYSDLRGTGHEYDVVAQIAEPSLPERVAGYRRANAYSGPDESTHMFYTDGLFSFSVFEFPRHTTMSSFDGADTIDVEGHDYAYLIDPAELRISWRTADGTYLLIGDLPPDHVADVLQAIPEPGNAGLLRRIWRGIFG